MAFQSAPASLRRENREWQWQQDNAAQVSIRSRLFEAGERFNGCFVVIRFVVSIRSRLFEAGEREGSYVMVSNTKFQSAPASLRRENKGPITVSIVYGGFNPLPPL